MPDDSWDDPEDEFDDAGTSEDFEPWSPATDYDDHLPATDNEPTAPLTLTVTVTNAAGTVSATATTSGWLQRVELSREMPRTPEWQLAQEIIATAKLVCMKGRAQQRTLIEGMLSHQGVDAQAARDYVDQHMNLPTPDQAAAAEAQARSRYLRGES